MRNQELALIAADRANLVAIRRHVEELRGLLTKALNEAHASECEDAVASFIDNLPGLYDINECIRLGSQG